MRKNKRNIKGQVVVEYILVIAAIVGMALIAYTLLKNKMRVPLQTFKKKVEQDSSDGGKPLEAYYNKMEFKTK
jgi:hypothetical protein